MSADYGPCPNCGKTTMYDDRYPSPCAACKTAVTNFVKSQKVLTANRVAAKTGNRATRRKAKKEKK